MLMGWEKCCSLVWMVPEIQHELISRNVWLWWVGWVLPSAAFCRYYRAEVFHAVPLMCYSIWVGFFFKTWPLWMVFTLCRLSSLNVKCGVSLAVDSQSKMSDSYIPQTAPWVGSAARVCPLWKQLGKTIDSSPQRVLGEKPQPSGWRGVLRSAVFTRMASSCSVCCWKTVAEQRGVPLQQWKNPPVGTEVKA